MHKMLLFLALLPLYSSSSEEMKLVKSTISNGAQVFQVSDNQISSQSIGQTLVGKVSSANSKNCIYGFWNLSNYSKSFETVQMVETKKSNYVIPNPCRTNAKLHFSNLKPKECITFKLLDINGREIDKTLYIYSFEDDFVINIQFYDIPTGIYNFVLADSQISENCLLIINK